MNRGTLDQKGQKNLRLLSRRLSTSTQPSSAQRTATLEWPTVGLTLARPAVDAPCVGQFAEQAKRAARHAHTDPEVVLRLALLSKG